MPSPAPSDVSQPPSQSSPLARGEGGIDLSSQHLHDLLESLDEAVFAAIAGRQSALQRVRTLWPALLGRLSFAVVEESREHFVRRAVEAIREHHGRDAQSVATAIELVEFLLSGCYETVEAQRLDLPARCDSRASKNSW
jgi:hypothetical protein